MIRAQLIELTATKRRPSLRKDWSAKLFNQRLAIIKRAIDSNIVNIIGNNRGHLAALHLGDPIVGMHDKNIDILAAAAAFYRRRAGVTGGCPENNRSLAASAQGFIKKSSKQLQGDILEGQRWSVEQFKNPLIGIDLNQWRNRLMTKGAVCFVDNGRQFFFGNKIIHKWPHNFHGQGRVIQLGQFPQLPLGKLG